MKRRLALVLTTILAASASAYAQQQVRIVSYDIQETPRSGWGCWAHDYDGTIVDTGRTDSSAIACTFDGRSIANYSGGSGTLNDGLVSASAVGSHLLVTHDGDDGLPIRPVITLHLGSTFLITSILISGGNDPGNFIPGLLTGATVEIGGTSQALPGIPSGVLNGLGVPVDDTFDLTGTPLTGIATDTIVLRDFTSSFFGLPFDQFSISEITVFGVPSAAEVSIDVKPNDPRNRIRSSSGELIAVAILSGPGFDAPTSVDPSSLTFGRSGDEQSLAFCDLRRHDGDDSAPSGLTCFFAPELAGFRTGDLVARLKGRTKAGTPITGQDRVCVDVCR